MTRLVGFNLLITLCTLSDKLGMRSVYSVLFFFFSVHSLAASGVKGVVQSPKECNGPVMVWLSLDKENFKERLLLMHTEVPKGGSFQFNLKPGDYQLRATDKTGCESLERISVKNKILETQLVMVKK